MWDVNATPYTVRNAWFLTAETLVPPAAKSEIVNAIATMSARDIRPFRFVEGDGFHLLADKLIDRHPCKV